MILRCTKRDLVKVINNVSRAAAGKSTLPEMKGILIETSDDGTVMMSASDSDFYVCQNMKADIEEPGEVMVPSRIFCEIIRKVPGNEIKISCDKDYHVSIKSEKSFYEVVGIDPVLITRITKITEGKKIYINRKQLEKMISMTAFSASLEESKGTAIGIDIVLSGNSIEMVSIDGFRMSVVRDEAENISNSDGSLIIVARVLSEVSKIIEEYYSETENSEDEGSDAAPSEIEMIIEENRASICFDDLYISMKLLEGGFADYKNLLPKEFKTQITLSKFELKDALERAYLVSKDLKNNLTRMKINEDSITINAKSETSIDIEELAAEIEGPAFEIGFNVKYVLDAINVIDEDEIKIVLNNAISPFIIRSTQHDKFDYMILPIRIM